MSWNGTVYCGYCGNKGHNRRGCPNLKEYVKENPGSYEAMKATQNKASAKNRSCSYCKEPGHTRRKCAVKNQHVQDFVGINSEYVKKVACWMKDEGIEPGTLIRVEENEWSHKTREYRNVAFMYLITGIRYQDINYEAMHKLGYRYSTPDVVLAKRVDKENQPRIFKLPHHEELHNLKTRYNTDDIPKPFEVVSKLKSIAAYPADMPDVFLTGHLGVKEVFDGGTTKEKRKAYENRQLIEEYARLVESRDGKES